MKDRPKNTEAARAEDKETRDAKFMGEALLRLKDCPSCEVPVAAVVVCGDEIVGEGVNRRETDCDPTAHAEIVAVRDAARKLGRWNLSDCELFVTLEPCVMCAGAIVYSRIRRVVFGAFDMRFGACGSALNIAECDKLNHRAEVVGGVSEDECLMPIREFFKARRKNADKTREGSAD
ncbi:MAG: tRNA adenosine(34) deaminase TadA [Roseburia sp.]|nr:tRNA adenosine(34) deaminase TadA [Roseburia sp.]